MKLNPHNIKIPTENTDFFDSFDSFLEQNDSNFNFKYIDTVKQKVQVIDVKKKKTNGLF